MENHIAAFRKQCRLSQAELAQAVGVSRQTITSLEVGKYTASLPLAFKLARYFECTIEDLFIFEEA
uniref:helix-turn-helix transcriptional regulator n=1 Tax=Candidatus Fimivicinus sp. TaxID=3056640 RepID=UPI003FEF08F9